MSLLVRALKYRERFLKEHIFGSCLGLLKKVLMYVKLKKNKRKLDTPTITDKKSDKEIKTDLKIKVEKTPNKNKSAITLDYSDIVDHISGEISQFSASNNLTFDNINNIISKNFQFIKSALLTYSPLKDKFILKSSINLNDQTRSKLTFDIKYNDIFKRMIKDNSYILYPDNLLFYNLKDIYSKKDFENIDFQLFIPFIFLGHVVGIFIGLKLDENISLTKETISGLEKIGILNGNLLYKIIQSNNE